MKLVLPAVETGRLIYVAGKVSEIREFIQEYKMKTARGNGR